jgi:hypothetical protein
MTANVTYRLSTAGTAPGTTTNKNAPLTNAEIDGNLKSILTDLDLKATIESPSFTGIPLSVTPVAGDNTTKIATTEFVSTNTVPKTAAATAGAFDNTVTTPTGTTRLNYGGYFYPTLINLIGTPDTATASTHYYVETGSDGVVRPKTLANVKSEIVTTASVNSAAATALGTVTVGTWSATTIAPNKGGTGIASYAIGDLVYASGTTTLSTLADVATGSALISGGVGAAPTYGKIGLTTHVTGTLALGSGGTGQTTAQAAINSLTGGVANATYLRGNGANAVMAAIQASDVPTLNQNTTGTATNAVNLDGAGTAKTGATEGFGYGLWNSTPITYGTLMSASTNVTFGGRNTGETTSDYNMYFTMSGGTNRGFVFRSAYGVNLFSVNPDGIRSTLAFTASSVNGVTGLGGAPVALGASAAAGSATTVSRSDHVHAFPTATNVGLGNVTNESKATMFTSPAFTGTATAVNLTVSGDLTISGTTTSVNSTTLDVADINITIAKNATTAAAANGAGLTIGNYASNPTLLYGSTSDNFTFNRNLVSTNIASGATVSGVNTGDQTSVSGSSGSTVAAATFTTTGGEAPGTTFNGSTARIIDYSTVGAAALSHTHGNITNAGAIGATASLPIITTTSGVLTTGSFGTAAATFCQGNDARLSDARVASDVYAWAKAATKPTYTKSEVGLGNVDNTADANKSVNYATTAGTANALNAGNSYSVVGLTVGNGQNSSSITMFDSDEGNRTIHCNSNQIGFLTQAGAWGAWLDDANNWTAAGNVTAYSDARLKTNIVKITGALDKVDQLNGYTFDRTDINTTRQTGVIAQEVMKVLPEAVLGTEETTYAVAYGNMVGLLIEAIKELRAEVAELRGMK